MLIENEVSSSHAVGSFTVTCKLIIHQNFEASDCAFYYMRPFVKILDSFGFNSK